MNQNVFIENLKSIFRITQEEGTLKFKRSSQEIEITDSDLVLRLFNEMDSISEDKLTIYYSNREEQQIAEVAISMNLRRSRVDEDGIHKLIEDNDNQIKYEMREGASDYYIVWLYKKMLEDYPIDSGTEDSKRIKRFLGSRLSMRLRRHMDKEGIELPLVEVMRKAIDCSTLKVTKDKEATVNLDDAIDSFSYTFMCNMDTPIKVYSIEEILGFLNKQQKITNFAFETPKRKYNSALLDYYNLAVASEDPFVTFISYYHIIEYYFDEVFREKQINNLRKSITSPRFSYKDDNQIYNIIEKIIKDNKVVRENGSGNEQQSLNYVLNKFLTDLDEFMSRLTDYEVSFYQSNSVSFSEGNVIVWNKERDKVLKAISNRVYKTRNALIHSKSSKKDVTYHPYLHRNELQNEISLIKAIAECIIETDSIHLP